MFDFYYHKLDVCDQRNYIHILDSMLKGQTKISLSTMTMPRLKETIDALINDHPEFFWFNPEAIKVEYSSKRMSVQIQPFLCTADISHINSQYKTLARKLFNSESALTEFQRVIRIHQYFIREIGYDSINLGVSSACAAGPILYGKAKCSGIARALKLLCDLGNIPCIVVEGTGKGQYTVEDHAWNMVCIQGKWTHIDVTWDITIGNGEKRYDYFGLTDDEIAPSHSWNRSIVPVCNSPKLNFHYQIGCYYSNLGDAMRAISKNFRTGGKSAVGRISGQCTEGEFLKLLEPVMKQSLSLDTFKYTVYFNKELRLYRIQLLLD